jgi:predicted dehydrogenase
MQKQKTSGKLGVALVGLGYYSTHQLAPALQQTRDCYLAGIVTGTPTKAKDWQQKYSIPDRNSYSYDNFDEIRNNPDIDIVYIVLPNSMHAGYTIRAAKAGKHVICEKPMALNVADCDKMIAACQEAGTRLSVGYRLHFEPYNLDMKRMGQEKVFGDLQKINAGFGFIAEPGWRLDKDMAGGGPLQDLGIYCIQGPCYMTGMQPIAVIAQQGVNHHPDKFSNIEESVTWQLEFPNGVTAACKTSYNEEYNFLRGEAENGWFELSPAYDYSGIKGKTSAAPLQFPATNQQAKQLDDFAKAIRENRPSPVPGEMGRRDVVIIQAVYEAMRTGARVNIEYGSGNIE